MFVYFCVFVVVTILDFESRSSSDRTANVYFTSTSDIDTKNRIRSLNEFSKINLNAIRREGVHDDGVFKDYQYLE